ncbi:MAG: hypothetical protein V1799_11470 [bacterium]
MPPSTPNKYKPQRPSIANKQHHPNRPSTKISWKSRWKRFVNALPLGAKKRSHQSPPVALDPTNEKPKSIAVFGVTTLIASVILFLMEGFGLLTYTALDSLGLSDQLLTQFLPSSFNEISEYYRYSHWLSYVKLLFFLTTGISAAFFLRYDERGRRGLEIACWIGLLLGGIETSISVAIWRSTKALLQPLLSLYGSAGSLMVSQAGTASIIFGTVLWIVPSVFIILYLRQSKIRFACAALPAQQPLSISTPHQDTLSR